MAKTGTRRAAIKNAASSARVSTTTPASTPRRAARLAAAGDGENVDVGFSLRDVAGALIRDPETFFTFRRVSDNRQIGEQLRLALGGAPVVFSLPVATGEVDVCEIDPKRYRFANSPLFFRSPGPPVRKEGQLLREPNEWQPQFTRWTDLPAEFDDLKRVLRESRGVTLFKESGAIAELLVEKAYDAMAGDRVVLAKTALLNTYYRLNTAMERLTNENQVRFPDTGSIAVFKR